MNLDARFYTHALLHVYRTVIGQMIAYSLLTAQIKCIRHWTITITMISDHSNRSQWQTIINTSNMNQHNWINKCRWLYAHINNLAIHLSIRPLFLIIINQILCSFTRMLFVCLFACFFSLGLFCRLNIAFEQLLNSSQHLTTK